MCEGRQARPSRITVLVLMGEGCMMRVEVY